MVETGDILKFDSFVALFNMADNKDYVRFPSTGPNMKNGEKFKVINSVEFKCYKSITN
jgi:hypothetical protein